MDPEQTEPPSSQIPQSSQPLPGAAPGQPISSAPGSPAPYGEAVINSEMTDKLVGFVSNPKVSKYLGNATKVVMACAVTGCILLVVAILAVVNLLNSVTSAIHP